MEQLLQINLSCQPKGWQMICDKHLAGEVEVVLVEVLGPNDDPIHGEALLMVMNYFQDLGGIDHLERLLRHQAELPDYASDELCGVVILGLGTICINEKGHRCVPGLKHDATTGSLELDWYELRDMFASVVIVVEK